jgi:hypothetical protein
MTGTAQLALRCAALCIVALAAGPWVRCAQADQYSYSDKFSSDKAVTDSYFHSEFLDELPDPWPSGGFLRYEVSAVDTVLSFHYGSVSDAYAWLKYELPLEGGTPDGVFATGEICLELVDTWEDGWIQFACFADQSQPWEWPVASGEPGLRHFEFVTSGQPPETVQVWFRGCNASIDDVAIVLHYWTAAEVGTWGRIKHLFGEPPE